MDFNVLSTAQGHHRTRCVRLRETKEKPNQRQSERDMGAIYTSELELELRVVLEPSMGQCVYTIWLSWDGCKLFSSGAGLGEACSPLYIICCLEHRAAVWKNSKQTMRLCAIMVSHFRFKSGSDHMSYLNAAAHAQPKLR